jgi:hypothetical protein
MKLSPPDGKRQPGAVRERTGFGKSYVMDD